MWITRCYKQGNTLAMTFPKQMQHALDMRPGVYYAMILTEFDTVEIRPIENELRGLAFKNRERAAQAADELATSKRYPRKLQETS